MGSRQPKMLLSKLQFGLTSATLMPALPPERRALRDVAGQPVHELSQPSSKPMRACQPVASVSAVVSETYQS